MRARSPLGATANWAKKGAIPAVSARKDCAKGGVEITADNKGDEAFTFELDGKKNTVKPGGSEKVFVKVAEDQAYKITINGPNGFTKTFTGILDCKTAETGTTGGSGGTPSPSGTPVPASGSRTGGATGGDLATTGSSSATPMIAGIAAALVVVGGAAVFFLRKKKTTGE
ncbi:hypothetical protein GCM10020000_53830 [Streptomyces olivoverticillatus]